MRRLGLIVWIGLLIGMAAAGCGEQTTEDRAGDCASPWDGNLDSFERQIRGRLNDPGSMETFGTYFTNGFALEPDGRLRVRMDWGARKAFGGMVRKQSLGYLDLDSCEVEITSWGF